MSQSLIRVLIGTIFLSIISLANANTNSGSNDQQEIPLIERITRVQQRIINKQLRRDRIQNRIKALRKEKEKLLERRKLVKQYLENAQNETLSEVLRDILKEVNADIKSINEKLEAKIAKKNELDNSIDELGVRLAKLLENYESGEVPEEVANNSTSFGYQSAYTNTPDLPEYVHSSSSTGGASVFGANINNSVSVGTD